MRRLTILLATLGALLLVPVAAASAANNVHITISGSGSGEVLGVKGELAEGTPGKPPVACSYVAPGPQSGVCDTAAQEAPPKSGFFGINVKADAPPGSKFAGWTVEGGFPIGGGCAEEAENPLAPCGVLLFEESEETTIKAVFTEVPGFFLTIAKTGEGTVTSSPAGIECTGAKTGPSKYAGECQEKFEGTVTLTASPATGYAFSAWAGCTEHVGLTCKVLMDKAKTVKVTFIKTPSFTVEKAGTGGGKVLATGISCDESCSKASSAIKAGASVTVKVTSAKGSEKAVFEGGTGSASGCSGETCTFTISENSSVKVKFNAIPTKTMTVNLTGPAKYKGKVSGKGIVKGLYGSAINCGAGCTSQTETFFSTDEVTLSAAAGTGYSFKGWSVSGGEPGTCTGTTSPCTVKTDVDKTISAKFE